MLSILFTYCVINIVSSKIKKSFLYFVTYFSL